MKQLKKNSFAISGILWFVFYLLACKSPNGEKPKNLLSKEKMADVLVEMHRAEALTNSAGVPSTDTSFYIFGQYEKDIFKKHQIDTADYYKSYKFYLVNPEEFTDLYKLVVNKITKQNKADSTVEAKSKKNKLKEKVDSTKLKPLKDSLPRPVFGKGLNMEAIRMKQRQNAAK